MKFDVFGYAFPHWKTHKGLGILHDLGMVPETVLLAPKKVLNHPQSKRKLTPEHEFFPPPDRVLEQMGWNYIVQQHEAERLTTADFAIILGARILPKYVIDRYPKGIINIHPGILPGNRGLDNLKWAIFNKWPIGATAHYIDHRIDMGRFICIEYAYIPDNCELNKVYRYLRSAEMICLKKALWLLADIQDCNPILYTPKLSAFPDELDEHLDDYWSVYKNNLTTIYNQ